MTETKTTGGFTDVQRFFNRDVTGNKLEAGRKLLAEWKLLDAETQAWFSAECAKANAAG